MEAITYDLLRTAVAGGHVALRARTPLQPGGGVGDKIMPPTFGGTDSAENRYAIEARVVGDSVSNTVLLDSVASQANRAELALLEGWELGELQFPVAYVDFTIDDELVDLGRVSVLEAPHRIADAIFRDSLLDGTLFRLSEVGRAITDATPAAATALFHYSPTALLFGMWDSTGPKGGLGSKFQRALVSEIVGFDAQVGRKVGSRIDPLQIEKESATLYEHEDPAQGWTLDEQEAAKEKGKPKTVGKEGKPSEINHGNVTPSIDAKSGGVTISRAVQTTVLSFPALRRLRFPVDIAGVRIAPERRREAEIAGHTAIAALGVAAIAYQYELDYDLRSRCLLVPEGPRLLELVPRDGSDPVPVEVSRASAAELLHAASSQAAEHGLGWFDRELRLEPAPKFVELIKRSRDLSRRVQPEEE
jgi:CRISPR-associated protein Csb1